MYISARVPVGHEVILGALAYGTKRPLKDLHVLDAGKYAQISTSRGLYDLHTEGRRPEACKSHKNDTE